MNFPRYAKMTNGHARDQDHDGGAADFSIIVLGVGNTLMQDDGVGIRVVKDLADSYDLPPRVRLVDAGVASFGLLPELAGASHLIVVDAVKGKGPPGTLYRLTPEELARRKGPALSAHEVGMCEILEMASLLGRLPQTVILGIEPLEAAAVGLDLTAPIQDALPLLVGAVVAELRALGVEAAQKSAAATACPGGQRNEFRSTSLSPCPLVSLSPRHARAAGAGKHEGSRGRDKGKEDAHA